MLKSYPHQLSGGMAQRVCIALALTGEPKLLVADEPTTALDVTVQAEILSLLRALVRDTGLSMVIVSHDLGVVADICDDVAVMYAGEVVESGSTAAGAGRPGAPVHDGAARGEPARARRRAGAGPAGVDRRHRARRPAPGRPAAGSPPAASSPRSSAPCRSSALPAHGDGSVRCIRVDELARANVTWDADDVGAEVVVGADPLEPVDEPAPTAGVPS